MRVLGLVLVSPLVLTPATTFAWGDLGHVRVTQTAHDLLPNGCLRTWYYDNGQALLEASLAPDDWRDSDPDEGPRHFLDIDIYGNPSAYPRELQVAVQQFGSRAAYANGTVPWVADTVYGQLVAAFRSKDTERAVALSGYLSHYVSDAHSPYHATVNYDGQLSGNPGIHGRYEADMLEARDAQLVSGLESTAQPRVPPSSLTDSLFDTLLHGVTLVDGINAVDIASGGNVMALWNGTGTEATMLMAQSAGLINALWISAYAEAGAPLMSGMPASCEGMPAPDAGAQPDSGQAGSDAGESADAGMSGSEDAGIASSDAGSSEPMTGVCACDLDFCCSESCACDPECGCACDLTFACDEGCECDPECHRGCPGFVDPQSEEQGSSCQSLFVGAHPGEVLILLFALALLRLILGRGSRRLVRAP